jgi:O-antigen/teichoic acid export membrane protein
MLAQLWTPFIFNKAGDGTNLTALHNARRLAYITGIPLAIAVAMLVGIALLMHELLFNVLVSPQYHDVSNMLPGMVAAAGIFALGQHYSLVILGQKSSRALLLPKIATALLGTLLNVVGAYYFGVSGVVVAMIAFATGYTVWIIYLIR